MKLHHVAFDDVAELLWKYHSPEQLVRTMHIALVGMSFEFTHAASRIPCRRRVDARTSRMTQRIETSALLEYRTWILVRGISSFI